jgi:tRNA(fMet)-specific endonuclease VapC
MTSPEQSLIDTDILSAIMRNHPVAITKAKKYLSIHHQLSFSIITKYEILRGLKAKGSVTQIPAFKHLCNKSQILLLTDEIITKAAEIYADLYQRGELISDADILISASAMSNGFTLITNNEKHFRRIAGLRIENWLKI